MYMTCDLCGSKHFLVDITSQENGNDDTYNFVCAGCGECVNKPEFNDYETYLVGEIYRVGNDKESICVEKWVEEGTIVFYVVLYRGEVRQEIMDFDTVDEAKICYKKCVDIFESDGTLDAIEKKLFVC